MMGSPDLGVDCVRDDPAYDFKHRNILDSDDNLYSLTEHSCNYYEIDEFNSEFTARSFSSFSYNIRSLPNKWNNFRDLIHNLNNNDSKFSVVALQEIWNVPPGVSFDLPGYRPFSFKNR